MKKNEKFNVISIHLVHNGTNHLIEHLKIVSMKCFFEYIFINSSSSSNEILIFFHSFFNHFQCEWIVKIWKKKKKNILSLWCRLMLKMNLQSEICSWMGIFVEKWANYFMWGSFHIGKQKEKRKFSIHFWTGQAEKANI